MVKVKICGLFRIEDIAVVNARKPDYIGFVFAESRRKVTPQEAVELRALLDPAISAVGVFVDACIEQVVAIIESGAIDVIQLHGSEDEAYIRKLKAQVKRPVIKAVSVERCGDVQKWAATMADYLLLDHKGGGSGESFDWELIGEVDKPFFLAGGLHARNVRRAIKQTRPFAVDVSSGVETDGLKDSEKIVEFISTICSARDKVKRTPLL